MKFIKYIYINISVSQFLQNFYASYLYPYLCNIDYYVIKIFISYNNYFLYKIIYN